MKHSKLSMSEVKHIYLVRHGRSRANETGIREGDTSPLTETGEEQATSAAERFKNMPIEVVLTSPYKRAHDTGKKIAEAAKVPLEIIPIAHERELPADLHGKHREDPMVKESVAKFEYSWIRDANVDDGEHFNDIRERVVKLTEILENRKEEHVVVTSHGFFLKFFVAHHLLGDYLTPDLFVNSIMTTMRTTNTGITYFVLEGGTWTLSSWNDSAHLGAV